MPSLANDRDFLKLWTGQGISQIGSGVTLYALPLTAVLVLAASPRQMGLLSGVASTAVLGVGLFAGMVVDRFTRRPLLIAADIGRCVVLASIPLTAAFHHLSMALLYVAAIATAILTMLFDVSYRSYLPSLVGEKNLLDANSKLAVTESIAEIAGPGLAGLLVQLITAPAALLLDAVSFLISAASLALIRKQEAQPERSVEPDVRRELFRGLVAIWRNPILRALAGRTLTASLFMGFYSSLYVLFAIRDLKLSVWMLGVIIATGGAANLLGAMFVKRLVRLIGIGPALIAAALLTGIGGLLPPLAHGSVALSAVMLLGAQLCDIGWPVYQINEQSLCQAITPAHVLGRVNAAMHQLFRGVLPLGAIAGGVLAEAIGVRAAMLIAGIGFLLSTAWLVFSPVRDLRTSVFSEDGPQAI